MVTCFRHGPDRAAVKDGTGSAADFKDKSVSRTSKPPAEGPMSGSRSRFRQIPKEQARESTDSGFLGVQRNANVLSIVKADAASEDRCYAVGQERIAVRGFREDAEAYVVEIANENGNAPASGTKNTKPPSWREKEWPPPKEWSERSPEERALLERRWQEIMAELGQEIRIDTM
jgi:hypothetical protein